MAGFPLAARKNGGELIICIKVMPKGTKIVSAESSGISAWTRTAKTSVILPDEGPANFFLKTISGTGARALAEGEWHSASTIDSLIPGLVPKAIGWGEYRTDDATMYFFLGAFHDMDFSTPPEPEEFVTLISQLHKRGASPNGMFGYPVPIVCGKMERTVRWEKSSAKSFTHQLEDVLNYDIETNGPWPEFEACLQAAH